MLATTEPYQDNANTDASDGNNAQIKTWADVLRHFSTDLKSESETKFRLTWDPFSKPLPSEVSRCIAAPNDLEVQWEARLEALKYNTAILEHVAALTDKSLSRSRCEALKNLRRLYDLDEDKVKTGTSKYTITLHSATTENWIEVVRVLLEANANVAMSEGNGVTPLHKAARLGHIEIVKLLLDAGATASARTSQ